MDWKDLAERLAAGEKQWRVFDEGAKAATQVWNLERARDALQADYDALTGKIEQAKSDHEALKRQGEFQLADAAVKAAQQRQSLETTFAARRDQLQTQYDMQSRAFQDDLLTWGPKIEAQKAESERLQALIAQLHDQIAKLGGIKAMLKSELAGVP